MSYLSRLSLANKSLVALATIAILLFGGIAIPALKQELFPSLTFPSVTVVSTYIGASPSVVEKDVTSPLEQNIQGLQGIQSFNSYSNAGSSIIVVQYAYGTDLDKASQTLTQQINRIQASLPSGVTPQVQTFNISAQPIMQLAVSSSQDEATLANNLKNIVQPQLQGVNGVANVNLTGVRNQVVNVKLDLKKLKDKGLSSTGVQSSLQANNLTLPAGEVTDNGQTSSVRVGNTFNSLDDLKNVIVGQQTKQDATCAAQALAAGGTSASGGASGVTGAGAGQGFPGAAGAGAGAGLTGAGAGAGAAAGAGASACPTTSTSVKLSDVATVTQDLASSTTLTRTNGKDSLGVSITKNDSGNTVSVSKDVQNLIPSLEKQLGNGAKINVVSDQAPSVSKAIDSLVREGLIGALFAILVILVFLFSIRSTLVTAISIPLSIVIALIGLWIGGYTLNLFTLGGLTIAVGRVIDDSIVVLENIYRHLNNGEEKSVAIPTAVREVAGAVTASTITTVCVFLPIAFVGGIVGQLFNPFSIAVTIALLASLFVALTIIPVLASWFLKAPKNAVKNPDGGHKETALERGYIATLGWVLSHKAITLIVAVLLFVGTVALVPSLGTNFFNSSQAANFTITQTLPVGTSLDKTNQSTQKIENLLANTQHVKIYQVTAGSSNSGFSALRGGGGANVANFTVTPDDANNTDSVQKDVQQKLSGLTDIGTTQIAASGGGGFNSSDIQVNVKAADDASLRQAAQQVLDAVSQVPNTKNANSNLSDASPLIDVHVDPKKASAKGLTASTVGQSLRQVYSGSTVTTVTLNGTQQNVNLKIDATANTVDDIKNLEIPTLAGTVKISDIADVNKVNGPTQITHIGGNRTATITTTATSQNTGGVTTAITQKLKGLSLPSGTTYDLGGVAQQQSDAFGGLTNALLAAIVLVYLVMVGTFRSLLQPLILLVSIPFAATGSILLMLISKTQLGLPSLIGLLMLIGIVVTNAIVLIDLVDQYRKKGMDVRTALLQGGSRRLRPILMTALATILALAPMALGLSQSSGFIAAPLAVTVIGGLASSTLLTLLLVPTLYDLIEGLRERRALKRDTKPAPVESTAEAEIAKA